MEGMVESPSQRLHPCLSLRLPKVSFSRFTAPRTSEAAPKRGGLYDGTGKLKMIYLAHEVLRYAKAS